MLGTNGSHSVSARAPAHRSVDVALPNAAVRTTVIIGAAPITDLADAARSRRPPDDRIEIPIPCPSGDIRCAVNAVGPPQHASPAMSTRPAAAGAGHGLIGVEPPTSESTFTGNGPSTQTLPQSLHN
jgi:hypothetical protein